MKKLFYLIGCVIIFYSCNIPKDPNNSWRKIQKRGLRVGLVKLGEHDSLHEKFQNREKLMLNDFSLQLNFDIKFILASETRLIKMLEENELDVVIGGFHKKSNWKTVVGMSTPYDSTHVFLIPKGENELLFHLEQFILNP